MKTLYRPIGLKELELIADSDFSAFPARLSWQPIFYPVLNQAYAEQIASEWNTEDSLSGYCGIVTRFNISDECFGKYDKQNVGGSIHDELWVPAEDLIYFNENIDGKIEIVKVFFGSKFVMPGNNHLTQLLSVFFRLLNIQDMATLNLIYPESSDIKYTITNFPDGQPHIKLDITSVHNINKCDKIKIVGRITNANELLIILLAKDILSYLEFEHVELYISYLMGARMDRIMQDGEPFTLKIVASALNQAAFKKVTIFDPHSDVTTALIDRSYAMSNHNFVKDAITNYLASYPASNYCIVSPDAGALKKVHKLAQYLQLQDVVECMKERDVKTGALTNFKTTADNLSGKTCFIIDDICDGGGTFLGTAKMLKQKGAEIVNLIVSHGIFSKGTDIDYIDHIYTTDSFRNVAGVTSFSVYKYLLG